VWFKLLFFVIGYIVGALVGWWIRGLETPPDDAV